MERNETRGILDKLIIEMGQTERVFLGVQINKRGPVAAWTELGSISIRFTPKDLGERQF